LPLGLHELIDVLAKRRVGEQPFDPLTGDGLQKSAGVVRERPELGIDLMPDVIGAVVPRPAQIERQFGERLETLHIPMRKRVPQRRRGRGRYVVRGHLALGRAAASLPST
jgi:hypothetical protein